MATRRDVFNTLPAAGAMLAVGEGLFSGEAAAQEAPDGTSWSRPSLVNETVIGPNGAVTTQVALEANAKWGITEPTAASQVAPGVYVMSGWALGQGMAIEAPEGWIIIDTGDSIRAATEMRAALERASGKPVKVAAILYTHWHYADGTTAFKDEGTEIWGHEWLDANRTDSSGVSIKSGFYRARAVAQFGVFHPQQGADAFPNRLGFTPEKLTAEFRVHRSVTPFQTRRHRDLHHRRRRGGGGAKSHRHIRQRRILLSGTPYADIELHGAGWLLQHL